MTYDSKINVLTLRLQKTNNVRAPFYFELGSGKVYSWLLAKRIIHLLHQIIVFYVAPNLNDRSGFTWTFDSMENLWKILKNGHPRYKFWKVGNFEKSEYSPFFTKMDIFEAEGFLYCVFFLT